MHRRFRQRERISTKGTRKSLPGRAKNPTNQSRLHPCASRSHRVRLRISRSCQNGNRIATPQFYARHRPTQTIEVQEESTVHHAFLTTCRATLFSAGRTTFSALAVLLLCVSVCLPAPALAAIYDGGVANGGIVDIPIDGTPPVDVGSGGTGSAPAPSDDLVMLRSLDMSGTTLRACAIAVGTTDTDLLASEELEASVLASTEETFTDAAQEDRILLTLDWDLSTLDTSKPGFNLIIARATLPEGYCWKDGSTQISFTKPTSVQIPNKPVLDTHYNASSHLMFPWVVPTEFNETAIHAYLSSGTSDWKDITSEDLGLVQDNGLFVYSNELSSGTVYRIRIEYPRGYAEIGFLFDAGNALVIDTISGDRDGGDGDGSGPADGEQPPPDNSLGAGNPSTGTGDNNSADSNQTGTDEQGGTASNPDAASPSSDSANNASGTSAASAAQPLGQRALERYSAYETTISGTRLADLCSASKAVFFDQNGVVIGLPSAFLTSLGLKPSDTLSVYAMQRDASSLSVALTVNNQPLPHAPGMTVRMPYEQQDRNTALTILDEDSIVVAQGVLNGTALSFTVDKPGTFHVVEGHGATGGNSENAGAQPSEPIDRAYAATLDGTDTLKKSAEEPALSLALALCAMGVLAAVGGFGILAFLRKRA
ncbi:MAG: hypothetical protein RR772_01430 [Gordonibacter sp.]